MSAPILSDFSLQYGATGIVLNGAPLSDGTIIDVTDIGGLDSAPVRVISSPFEGRDGGVINAVFEDMRTIPITCMIYAGSTPINQTLEALKANFAPSDVAQPLYFQPGGITQRQLFAKSLGVKYNWTQAMRTGQTPAVITLQTEDPTIYGTSAYSVLASLVGSTAMPGYKFNRLWSYTFGGAVKIGQQFLTNAGTKETGFLATITGFAVTNPRIIGDTVGGATVRLNLTAGSSDTLVFDFYNQAVILNGSTRHAAVTQEGWFKLQPGVNSVRLQSDSTTAASIVYSYFDAYR